ncbi:potassium channel family protein [Facklamia miroungae]|uniref:Trk system potassium uptake protein TrkA n=1 Tax=Facklamia miroungae TaxID=120956 RepID=A0A1G7T113_9LACT|nr:TrkA family potassium uptake protein [Facklamia miroungae]NKZ29456.1 TrkA family potassium uptake protein [Facklamia miroungae]SDG28898.1 trk system potassium uptake protein TrkA [Facklamia miroungae]
MKKEIIAVLGLGLFGTSLAKTLADNHKQVIVIDRDMELVEAIASQVEVAVQGDFTKYEVLKEAGVGEAKMAIIASSSKFDNTITTLLSLQKLRIPIIIAKTRKEEYKEVLLKLGVDRVILPETDMGVRIGNELTNDSVLDLIQLDSQSHIVEFTARKSWIGKTIEEINFRGQYDINLIAIKSRIEEGFDVNVNPSFIIEESDLFVGLTNSNEAKMLLEKEV